MKGAALRKEPQIALSGNESVLTSEKEIAITMNNYFINITKHLHLEPHTASSIMDIEQITSAFNKHVSAKEIRIILNLQKLLRKVLKMRF